MRSLAALPSWTSAGMGWSSAGSLICTAGCCSPSLGIPILPCALEISICQTVWWLWPVSLARICENVISNHRTRRDGKTITRTMRQTEACSSFVRIQHGCSRSEALFRCSCGNPFSSQLVIYRRFVTPLVL